MGTIFLNLILIIITTVITAFVSISGGLVLLSDSKFAKLLQKISTPFAVLVLFYAAFFDVIPEVLESNALPVWQVALLIFIGIIFCAFIRIVAGRFHHHDDKHSLKGKGQATAMFIVDSLHTAADGVVLGLAFAASPGTGIVTAAATAAHEIPQEIGDFSIMMRSKITKNRIIKLQLISALILVPVSIIAYFVGESLEKYMPILLSLIAGNLIFIALGEIWQMIKSLREKLPSLKEKEL